MDYLYFFYLTVLAAAVLFVAVKVLSYQVPDWMKLTVLVGLFFLFHALAWRGII